MAGRQVLTVHRICIIIMARTVVSVQDRSIDKKWGLAGFVEERMGGVAFVVWCGVGGDGVDLPLFEFSALQLDLLLRPSGNGPTSPSNSLV